jgi:hypothetical protein
LPPDRKDFESDDNYSGDEGGSGSDSGSAVRYPPSQNHQQGEVGSPDTVVSTNQAFPENNPQSGEDENDETSSRRARLAEASLASVRNVVSRWQSSRQRQESSREYTANYKQTMEVYRQALWYVGAFYITHVWSTSNRIIQFISNENPSFLLVVMHAWFDPLQGFLNYLVYQRPRYLKLRKKYPSIGRIGALWRMLKFTYLPDPEHWNDNKATTYETGRSRREPSQWCVGKLNVMQIFEG